MCAAGASVRVQDGTTGANQVHYLFADHLGSTNVTYNTANGVSTAQRYYPWGTVRPGPNNALPTGYTFTGQLDSGLGLMYYGARFYDGALGRFISPDTIVPSPGDPQSLNRYSYVGNRPTVLVDPLGMCALGPQSGGPGDRAENLAYQSGCWSVYYSLLDQGIPGLDWQWDYGLGITVEAFADLNFAVGSMSILGLAGTLSYQGQDILGYLLLTVGGSVALINGLPTYYIYVNETAAHDAAVDYAARSTAAGVGHPNSSFPLFSQRVARGLRPGNLRGRVEKLVPFSDETRYDIAAFTVGAKKYIDSSTYLFSGDAYTDMALDATGFAAFAHSAATARGPASLLKLLRSAIGNYGTVSTRAGALTTDYARIDDLYSVLDNLPSQ